MPVILRESWGRALSDYIDASSSEEEDEGVQLLDSLKNDGIARCLDKIDVISLLTLRAICRLAWTPEDLRGFKDSSIVPSLMKSLRGYCRKNQVSCLLGFSFFSCGY